MENQGQKLYNRYLKVLESFGGGGDSWGMLDPQYQAEWETLAWDLINNCGATL